MVDTTVKIDSKVRDRLAELAAERGTTIRDLVHRLAASTPTRAELARRQAIAAEYVRTHLRPEFGPEDLAVGERLWQTIEAGRVEGGGEVR